eukprot:2734136-Amphidinium_carterae.2
MEPPHCIHVLLPERNTLPHCTEDSVKVETKISWSLRDGQRWASRICRGRGSQVKANFVMNVKDSKWERTSSRANL